MYLIVFVLVCWLEKNTSIFLIANKLVKIEKKYQKVSEKRTRIMLPVLMCMNVMLFNDGNIVACSV